MSTQASTDLWLERAHFSGIILAAVSYGAFVVLTLQALMAIFRTPKRRVPRQITRFLQSRFALLAYLISTLVLATVGVAVNIYYSQIVWIDSRGSQRPETLISNGLAYWQNVTALSCYYMMSWILDVLLIHRCFVIWNRSIYVALFMSTMLLVNLIMGILTLVTSTKGIEFGFIKYQLGYLIVSVSTTFLYTILIVGRLLLFRRQVVSVFGKDHSSIYVSVATMIVESAAPYSIICMFYVVTFAIHSNAIHLVFLCITHAQGIAQLPIIIRVAEGKAINTDLPGRYPTDIHLAPMSFYRADGMAASQEVPARQASETAQGSTGEKTLGKPSVDNVDSLADSLRKEGGGV
ncbi:hypothetical protein BU17DRAFT_48856 [Hysterangium stoloniferum]|nr:hypothetical protein BU17DRAFT_48856 [Hysterangium stoloniferum]